MGVDDPLFEEALREVNEEDRGDELSQTDEDQPSEVVEEQLEDGIPAAQTDQTPSTPPNSRRPKAPRAPRARQQWEKYSFRGEDGPCRGEFPESGMIHPRTPPCERTLARARRGAHQPRPDGHTHRGRCSLNLRTMRTIRLAW